MDMSKMLGFSLLLGAAIFVTLGYENIEAEPINITIEHVATDSTGLSAKPIVEELYTKEKQKIIVNLKEKEKTAKDPDTVANISSAYDSIACMDRSMEGYPKLIDIIDGDKMPAPAVFATMEENCVIDSLVNIKNNKPKRFESAKEFFESIGFNPVDLNEF